MPENPKSKPKPEQSQKPNPSLTQRVYLLLHKRDDLLVRYTRANETLAREQVANWLKIKFTALDTSPSRFEIVSLPSRSSVMLDNGRHPMIAFIQELVVTLLVDPRDVRFFQNLMNIQPLNTVTAFGFDAPVRLNNHWTGGIGLGNVFNKRARAESLIGRNSLIGPNRNALTGQGVNVVLIDSGLDTIERQQLGMNFGHTHIGTEHSNALPFAPAAPRYDHAHTMARNFKKIAPNVTLHDYAVIPPRQSKALIPSIGVRVAAFLSDMVVAYITLKADILLQQSLGNKTPWVVCNAWSVYKRDASISIDTLSDPLNARISDVAFLNADIIFCAGNGGQFGNDPRSGAYDRGPGRSIIGPNGHPDVLTVGSVRTDGGWIGSSSQGPGIMDPQQLGAIQKPDIVAPSDFIENEDASQLNTGTSTSCAVTAAVIAAIREGWPQTQRSALKQKIIVKANQMHSTGWNNRTGYGILDIKALLPI